MRFELCDCENVLLREIASPEMRRRDVALTYALALRSGEAVNWTRVNQEIIARWSMSALVWIKTKAWKLIDEQAHPAPTGEASPPKQDRTS